MKPTNLFVGSPVERLEDLRFVRGRGQYVDDVTTEGVLHASILRSSLAHGRLRAIDAKAALALPGVHAVITAADMGEQVPHIPMRLQPLPGFQPFEQPVIADKKVRYVGEPVALVIAETAAIAEDAANMIDLDIEPLPPVPNREVAAENVSLLFETPGTNQSMIFRARRGGDFDNVFKNAPYVRREKFSTQRHTALPMEPRGVHAVWDAQNNRMTVFGAAKVPFFNRRTVAKQLGLPEDAVDLIENDVGGGFGARGEFYPEDFLIPFASRHVNRPVKWTEDRREHLMAMNHARQAECDVEIACERDGKILGLRGKAWVDMGAYMRTNGAVGARNIVQFMSGPYRIPNIELDAILLMTNKTPVGTYRGPGRFETDFFRERLLEMVADDLGIDRVEFRRRNLVSKAEMPFELPSITPFDATDELDSGDYHEALDRCLQEIGWDQRVNQRGKQADGKHYGLAVGCFIEGGAAGPKETAKIVLESDGMFSVLVGSSAVGQGLETAFAQIAADALEVPMDRLRGVLHGSTTHLSEGYGSYHSRAVVMGGSAIINAAGDMLKAIRDKAAERLGCEPAEVEVVDGLKVTGPGGKSLPLAELAGLSVDGAFVNKKHTWTYGAHAAYVAVDAKIGRVELLDYVIIEDCGRIINPNMVRGQVIGSAVQGLGGAMLEDLIYDDQAQLLTGSLADYLVPLASDFPVVRSIVTGDHPSPINPLGAKGAGEGGIIAAGGVMANAVADALREFDVQPRVLPLTPTRVWELVQAAAPH